MNFYKWECTFTDLYELLIPKLRLWVSLGCSLEEKANLQPVDINIKFIFQNEPVGCQSDQLSDVVCYQEIARLVTRTICNQSFNLIEFLAAHIFHTIASHIALNGVLEISIAKPNHPVIDVQEAIIFISLDSYYPEVIQKTLELYPIDWINDVLGNEDEGFLNFIAKTKCKIIINHSLGIPPSQHLILPFDENPIESIYEWAQKKIDLFKVYGIEKNRIILDPGIGFGKTISQSFSLLSEIKYLKNLGCEVLLGHSRKSFLNFSSTKPYFERDIETLGVSHYLYRQGVDYLRVHNVELHHRYLSSLVAVEGCYGF